MSLIHVVAGAIQDGQGRVLVARRPLGVHQGGLWEFPGGKLEPGELPLQGLARELEEEVGIRVQATRPLIRLPHDYGDRRLVLEVHRVTAYAGEPIGREGQPLSWRHPDDLDPKAFPAADRPIITALRLPSRYLISGDDPAEPALFLARLARALAEGIELVQLRAHDLPDADYAALASAARDLCRRQGARLLLNRDPARAWGLSGDGLHLTSQLLAGLRERPLGWRLVGASCHGAEELARAADLGLDYALLSPIRPKFPHPEAPHLGWEAFAALVTDARLPVYALGGLGPEDLDQAIDRGGQGIAAIRGFWSV